MNKYRAVPGHHWGGGGGGTSGGTPGGGRGGGGPEGIGGGCPTILPLLPFIEGGTL